MTHRYTGHANVWGLKPGAPCRIVEARGHSGGLVIDTGNGRTYLVAPQHVIRDRRLTSEPGPSASRSWWRRVLGWLAHGVGSAHGGAAR